MASENGSGTGRANQYQTQDTRQIISSLKDMKSYNEEQSFLKNKSFSEAQKTGLEYKEGTKLL